MSSSTIALRPEGKTTDLPTVKLQARRLIGVMWVAFWTFFIAALLPEIAIVVLQLRLLSCPLD